MLKNNEKCCVCQKESGIYNIAGTGKWLCQKCFNESNTYEECVICKSIGEKTVYDVGTLKMDKNEQLYCKTHFGCDDIPLTDEEQDFIDKNN